jgi:hypothetical protein
VFYIDHMAPVYLVNKSQVLGRIDWWLLLFLEYTVVYKLCTSHGIAGALSQLPNGKPATGIQQLVYMCLCPTGLVARCNNLFKNSAATLMYIKGWTIQIKFQGSTLNLGEGCTIKQGQDMVYRQVLDFLKAEIMMKELWFGTEQGHFFLRKSLLERTRM